MVNRARGCDYSSAQSIRQVQASLARVDFGIVKATEGIGYVSSQLAGQVVELRKAGKLVGAYHFLTEDDGVRQWDHFESIIRPLGISWVAVDHERDERGVIPADHIAQAFIRRGRQRGYKVGRYGSAGGTMLRNLGESWRWVADWTATPPRTSWQVWQFSDGEGRQDFDVYHGDAAQLAAFYSSLHPKAMPKPRWWLRDVAGGRSFGPYLLARAAAVLVAYAVRHPKSTAFTLERK